jgi:hypothetical protein
MSYIADRTVRETVCKLFLLTFTAEVPVKYSFDPSHPALFFKFYRVAQGVLYLPKDLAKRTK